jgi:ubiquinone/menaquinone biosynthesis C-methylase UbiE
VHSTEGRLGNSHYERFFTTHFGLTPEFYAGKRVLDIGCGPRGSLEWAVMASERIGLDPLAEDYLRFGTATHGMTYVSAPAEGMPFPGRYFDVITSFNSLDHVNDLECAVNEIKRVAAPGGLFLLLTDVNHEPTVCEPISFSWNIVDQFAPEFVAVTERRFEKNEPGIYASADAGVPYRETDETPRYGVLSAKLVRTYVESSTA